MNSRTNSPLVDHCWAAFQVGLAGIATTLLLTMISSVPFCNLGAPRTPAFEGSLIYNTMPGDVEVMMSGRGYSLVAGEFFRDGERVSVPTPRPGRRVIIDADRSRKYGDVLEVLRAAGAAGQRSVVLRTHLPPPHG